MSDYIYKVIKDHNGIRLSVDIDSYVVVNKKLDNFVVKQKFGITTEVFDATKFNERKLLRGMIHQFPHLFTDELNKPHPILYEMKLGGSGKHDNIYMVFREKSIPEDLREIYHIKLDESTSCVRNARYCFVKIVEETVSRMPHDSVTALSNRVDSMYKGAKNIYICETEWAIFCNKLTEVLNSKGMSFIFFYKIAHGLKMPISPTGLTKMRNLMRTVDNKETMLKQIHIGLTLDAGEGGGIFIDLNKIWALHERPNVITKFHTYSLIDKKIGTFNGITSVKGLPAFVTNLNAYCILHHQKKDIILRYAFLTSVLLGKEIQNPAKKDFVENFISVISKYCDSISEGMPLRIEPTISIIDDVDVIQEDFIVEVSSEVLSVLIKKEVLLKIEDCSFYGERLKLLLNKLLDQYYNCRPPYTKVQLSKLCICENEFWSALEGTNYLLSIPKAEDFENVDFRGSNEPGVQLNYLKEWRLNFITEECLSPEIEMWFRYKELLLMIYNHCLCVNDWTSELDVNEEFREMTDDEKLIYSLLLMYVRHAKYSTCILPSEKEFLLGEPFICPIKHLRCSYINTYTIPTSRKQWYHVLEAPSTIAQKIANPSTVEGKILSNCIIKESKRTNQFTSKITSFLKKYKIDAFPTFFIYNSETTRLLWSQIWLSTDTSVPDGIELSGDLRSIQNLNRWKNVGSFRN